MEHRWGERVALDCLARLVLGDGSGPEGRVRNASISGAWIDTVTALPIYTPLNVRMSAGMGLRRRTVELPACVARTGPGGVAVEWRDMGEATLVDLLQQAGAGGPDS
jgi:hypothetical protein